MSEHWETFYRDEADHYETTRYGTAYGKAFRAIHRAIVDDILSQHEAGRALDVASGTGQLLPCLMRRANHVVASDLTTNMLAVSRKLHIESCGVGFCRADAVRLPFADGTFDIVSSSRFLHLFDADMQLAILKEMARVTKRGGTVMVDYYNATARRALAPLIWVYRIWKRRREEEDARISIAFALAQIQKANLEVLQIRGIGSYLLAPLARLFPRLAVKAAVLFERSLIVLAEQFVVAAKKR